MNAQRVLTQKATTGPVPAYEPGAGFLTPRRRETGASAPEFEYDVPAVAALLGTSFDAALTVDEQGMIVDLNPAAERMFGWNRDELIGTDISAIVPPPPEDVEAAARSFDPIKSMTRVHGRGWHLYGERRDGSRFPVDAAVGMFAQHGVRYFTGFVRDMTESLHHAEQMHHMATHDAQSGLLNYGGFVRSGSAPLYAKTRVVVFKLEEYRRFSITYGEPWCDGLLDELAARLRGFLNQTELAARVHEDMFALLLPHRATVRATALAAMLSKPFVQGAMRFRMTATIGISDLEGAFEERLRSAQLACERSGSGGAGRIHMFSADLRRSMEREVQIEARLRHVLAEGQLSVVLQPKLTMAQRRIVGAEALVRWDDPELGRVPPSDFIPIAERLGLVGGITDWVLKQSLLAISCCADPSVSVAVNFSALDFFQPDLAEQIALAVRQVNVAPSRLVVELTESVLAHDVALVDQQMRKIKALGATISLDDFGTGYSSLSYLRQFPIDSLKIDRSFVRDLPDCEDAMAITSSIVAMAKSLKLGIVAEGVETEGQAQALRRLGVDLCQGYLFSAPVPPAEFHRLLEGKGALPSIPNAMSRHSTPLLQQGA